jgi:hypothetical protein
MPLTVTGQNPWVLEHPPVCAKPPAAIPPTHPQDKAIIRSALEVAYKDNKALAEKAEFLEKVVQVTGHLGWPSPNLVFAREQQCSHLRPLSPHLSHTQVSITLTEPADKALESYLVELGVVGRPTAAGPAAAPGPAGAPAPAAAAEAAAAAAPAGAPAPAPAAAPAPAVAPAPDASLRADAAGGNAADEAAATGEAAAEKAATDEAAADKAAAAAEAAPAPEPRRARPPPSQLLVGDDFDPKESASLAALLTVQQLSRRSPREVKRLLNHMRLAKSIWRAYTGSSPTSDERCQLLGWVFMSCFHATALQTVLDAKVRGLATARGGGGRWCGGVVALPKCPQLCLCLPHGHRTSACAVSGTNCLFPLLQCIQESDIAVADADAGAGDPPADWQRLGPACEPVWESLPWRVAVVWSHSADRATKDNGAVDALGELLLRLKDHEQLWPCFNIYDVRKLSHLRTGLEYGPGAPRRMRTWGAIGGLVPRPGWHRW